MTTIIQITIAAALILSIIVPFGAFLLGEEKQKTLQKIPGGQLLLLFRNPSGGYYRYVRRHSKRTGSYRRCRFRSG